jgi:hypothetical protein
MVDKHDQYFTIGQRFVEVDEFRTTVGKFWRKASSIGFDDLNALADCSTTPSRIATSRS